LSSSDLDGASSGPPNPEDRPPRKRKNNKQTIVKERTPFCERCERCGHRQISCPGSHPPALRQERSLLLPQGSELHLHRQAPDEQPLDHAVPRRASCRTGRCL